MLTNIKWNAEIYDVDESYSTICIGEAGVLIVHGTQVSGVFACLNPRQFEAHLVVFEAECLLQTLGEIGRGKS